MLGHTIHILSTTTSSTTLIIPEIIFKGLKIMYCKINNQLNIGMLDSLNFLPMAVSQLPNSFGLEELKKDYFPHLYNAPKYKEDFDKVLPNLPDMHFYDVDNMRCGAQTKFMEWYEKNRNKPFHFHTELLSYCRFDVDILLNVCWKFRSLVMHVMGPTNPIDPFNYTTIASTCMGIFCSKFLPKEWNVLLRDDTKISCHHEWLCSCTWEESCKTEWEFSIADSCG